MHEQPAISERGIAVEQARKRDGCADIASARQQRAKALVSSLDGRTE